MISDDSDLDDMDLGYYENVEEEFETEIGYAVIMNRWKLLHESNKVEFQKSPKFTERMGMSIFSFDLSYQVLSNELINLIKDDLDGKIRAEAVKDDIYTWNIKLGNFNGTIKEDVINLKSQWGYDYVELEFNFSFGLSPYYPPIIDVKRPKLTSNVHQLLGNLEILQLKHWNPAKPIRDVILYIHSLLNSVGRIEYADSRNDPKFNDGSYLKIEKYLTNLSSVFEIDPRVKNELKSKLPPYELYKNPFATNNVKEPAKIEHKKKSYFPNGTGYSSHSDKSWNIDAYFAAKEQRSREIDAILTKIIKELENCLSCENHEKIKSILENSALLPFLDIYIRNASSPTEMEQNERVMKDVHQILQIISNHNTWRNILLLLNDHTSILGRLKTVYNLHKKSKAFAKIEGGLLSEFATLYKDLLHNIGEENSLTAKKLKLNENSTHQELYKTKLQSEVFEACKLNVPSGTLLIKSMSSYNLTAVKRISHELSSLEENLPVRSETSIFVRVCDDQFGYVRALITGPENTPYESGCYLFDIIFPTNYPENPPKVTFLTTGNGSVRFNPNLYENGKVCLSLLGTWSGEQWDKRTSTLLQVLLSIQSLIFVEEPYFNEPGYQAQIGTTEGKVNSESYNKGVLKNNLTWGILNNLKNPCYTFKSAIEKHFYYKKTLIINKFKDYHQEPTWSSKLEQLERELELLKV